METSPTPQLLKSTMSVFPSTLSPESTHLGPEKGCSQKSSYTSLSKEPQLIKIRTRVTAINRVPRMGCTPSLQVRGFTKTSRQPVGSHHCPPCTDENVKCSKGLQVAGSIQRQSVQTGVWVNCDPSRGLSYWLLLTLIHISAHPYYHVIKELCGGGEGFGLNL